MRPRDDGHAGTRLDIERACSDASLRHVAGYAFNVRRSGLLQEMPRHGPRGEPHGVNGIATGHPTVKAGGIPVAV